MGIPEAPIPVNWPAAAAAPVYDTFDTVTPVPARVSASWVGVRS